MTSLLCNFEGELDFESELEDDETEVGNMERYDEILDFAQFLTFGQWNGHILGDVDKIHKTPIFALSIIIVWKFISEGVNEQSINTNAFFFIRIIT